MWGKESLSFLIPYPTPLYYFALCLARFPNSHQNHSIIISKWILHSGLSCSFFELNITFPSLFILRAVNFNTRACLTHLQPCLSWGPSLVNNHLKISKSLYNYYWRLSDFHEIRIVTICEDRFYTRKSQHIYSEKQLIYFILLMIIFDRFLANIKYMEIFQWIKSLLRFDTASLNPVAQTSFSS